MTPRERQRLDEHGFVILDDFMNAALLTQLRAEVDQLFDAEGESAGSEFRQEPQTRRLANLADKGEVFRSIVCRADVLEYIEHVLGADFKLSSLNARSANPHSDWTQPLHVDGGLLPDERGPLVCNTVWLLDDFTPQNGALRVVPGTHLSGRLPQDTVADPRAPHTAEILVTAPAGTMVVMNAHLWHGGTANRTDGHRRAIHGFYCRGDVAQQQYQKKLLSPATLTALTPGERKVLAVDDARNDALCAEETGRSGFLRG